jgi:hypothetical protein
MPIVEFSNLNKYDNIRTRRFYQNKSNLNINPSKLGSYVGFKLFKYTHTHFLPPSLTTINGKRYIMPLWQEVLHGTTLKDINWIKPKIKRAEIIEHKFNSSSSNKIYITKEYVAVDGSRKYVCNCFGAIRAFDKRCIHIKNIEK